ncbi:uncharacterized protein [Elaeis guineensis]|uniref:Uncharacterized protein LOC105045127 n=1 Tax=Elaeis guineensis var. tenera TaxID=51953 RepID=A0A6I9R772_ELAGV|nr:uncharacterized protein LOC105045127 [Elaeis guineensis]
MSLSCYSIPMEKEEENKDMTMSPKKASSTPTTTPRPRKRSNALRLVQAALFMTRPSSKKEAPAQAVVVVQSESTSFWKSLLAGMRPLHHHQLEHQEVAPPELVVALPALRLTKVDSLHEVFTPATSPMHSDGMSGYASAEDLHVLDTCEDGDAERDGGDDGDDGEPNEIDVKAEEFIARFYEQQRLESIALQE